MFEGLKNWWSGGTPTAQAAPEVNNSITDESFSINSAQAIEFFTGASNNEVVVTPQSAMRVSTVFACLRLISGAKAGLPLEFYQRKDGYRQQVEDHPLWWLFNEQPTPSCSAAVFWEYIEASRHLYGDGFAYLVRNRVGEIIEAIPVHPLQVIVERKDSRRVYYIDHNDRRFGVDQDDMLHFCNFGFDGYRSMSTLRWGARNAVGIAQAADSHSTGYYKNPAVSRVALKYPNKMNQEQVDSLRAQWDETYSGSHNLGKPLILTEGGDAFALNITAIDAQLLEARKFQVVDIARAFGVPPFMVGETEKTSAWGSGVAEMGQGFINYTLNPHLVRDEQELNRKLFKTSKYYVEFDRSALLRGDPEKLGKYYREAVGGSQGPGWVTVNEVRRWEKLSPITGGDERFVLVPKSNEAKPKESQ